MGLPDIKQKLNTILQKDIFEESEVVYILSRIRKILEISGKEKEVEYKKLKFYCDWALHYKIDNTSPMAEELIGVPGDVMSTQKFFTFQIFDEEFKKFLNELGIKTKIYESKYNEELFHAKLGEIYKDTPLIIKEIKKKKLTLTNMRPPTQEKLPDGPPFLLTGYSFSYTDED